MRTITAAHVHAPIEVSVLHNAVAAQLVAVDLPGQVLALQPDEARKVALALIEAAGEAERPEPTEWP